MTRPGICLDEDAPAQALIEALRARGVVVLTTGEAGMNNRSDEDQLELAAARNLVLATSNVVDFARLHADWQTRRKSHAGIILIRQQKWGPGELARRITRLLATVPVEALRNRMEFISNW